MSHYRHYPKKRWLFVVAILSALVMGSVAQVIHLRQSNVIQDKLIGMGLIPVDANMLRSQVLEFGIAAYWTGPEEGFNYTIETQTKGEVVLKYIALESDRAAVVEPERVITTYAQKRAFEIVRDHPKTSTSLSFINADGNSVFIDSSSPTSVYVGFKERDIQVWLLDKRATRNLALASEKGRLKRIA